MSLVKTADKAMQYELAGTKTASKGNSKKVAIKTAEQLSTSRLLWIVVKRHKVAILTAGNIVLVLNTIFPPWFDMLKSIF